MHDISIVTVGQVTPHQMRAAMDLLTEQWEPDWHSAHASVRAHGVDLHVEAGDDYVVHVHHYMWSPRMGQYEAVAS